MLVIAVVRQLIIYTVLLKKNTQDFYLKKEYSREVHAACGMRHAVVLRRRQPRARVRTRIGLGLCVGWVATFYGLLASGWKDLEEAMPMSCGQQVLQIPNDAWNAG